MKSACFAILTIMACMLNDYAQVLPDGFILQYTQNFTGNKAMGDFWFSHPAAWAISKTHDNTYLSVNQQAVPDSQAATLPPGRCILKNSIFGDFILEVDVNPAVQNNSSSEACFFLGLKDSTRYYFILLSTSPSDEMQGIYLVRNSVRTKLPERISTARALVSDSWQKIRIERNITHRTIRVYEGSMSEPVLEVKDYELVMGRLGFGSLKSTVSFDNLSIWAPTVIPEESDERRGTRDK